MPRKRPKSLDAPVVTQAKMLEAWVYVNCDRWKKKYRFTLVNEYRQSITAAKCDIISAFELPNRFRDEKLRYYYHALGQLSIAESHMDIMIMDQVGVMSGHDWAVAAEQIDNIRTAVVRLVNSLTTKGVGGSESPNHGTERASADYKDA